MLAQLRKWSHRHSSLNETHFGNFTCIFGTERDMIEHKVKSFHEQFFLWQNMLAEAIVYLHSC